MATGVYTHFKTAVANSSVDIASSTFKCLLYSTDYIDVASTQRTDQDFVLNGANSSNSVEAFELSTTGAGYDRVTLGANTITEVDARDAVEIDAADVTFSSVSSSAGTAGGMCIFAEIAASDSSGRLVSTFYDFATPVSPNGGDITVQFSTGGWLEFLASTSDAS